MEPDNLPGDAPQVLKAMDGAGFLEILLILSEVSQLYYIPP